MPHTSTIVWRHYWTYSFGNEVWWIGLQQDLVQFKILDDVSDITVRNESKSGQIKLDIEKKNWNYDGIWTYQIYYFNVLYGFFLN